MSFDQRLFLGLVQRHEKNLLNGYQIIGENLGTSAQAAQQRYGEIVEQV
jgi:hypothetical protein